MKGLIFFQENINFFVQAVGFENSTFKITLKIMQIAHILVQKTDINV